MIDTEIREEAFSMGHSMRYQIAAIFSVAALTVIIALFASALFQKGEGDLLVDEERKQLQSDGRQDIETGKILSVPAVCQYPELPTGCESAAAAMVLQYYGEDVTATEFASDWLLCSQDFYTQGEVAYGPNPNEVFVGDPFSQYSYGCYETPIVNAVNEHSGKCGARRVSGSTLEELCGEYIDDNSPVMIWATMGMQEPKVGRSWRLPDGEDFTWMSGEHCLVLVGYNEQSYFLLDPQTGAPVSCPKELAERRYREMGSRAVIISESLFGRR